MRNKNLTKNGFNSLPKNVIEKLNETQKRFLWSDKKCKVKRGALCNDHKKWRFKKCIYLTYIVWLHAFTDCITILIVTGK